MSTPSTNPTVVGRLRSTSRFEGGTRTLKLSMEGEVDLDSVDAIRILLEGAHDEAQKAQAEEVALDLTQLEFLNSSGIKHLVTWFRNATKLAPERAYRIRLISNPLVPWQRSSLNALKCFAPQLLTIDTVSAS